jgi:hypothetical protein
MAMAHCLRQLVVYLYGGTWGRSGDLISLYMAAGLGTGSRRNANNGYGSMGTAVVAARAGRQAMRATRAVRPPADYSGAPRTCGVREATTSISGELYGRPWRQVELALGAKTDMGEPHI